MIKFDKKKYYYHEDSANKVIRFIENHITHVKGELAGQKIKLEDWQKEDILKPVFGIKRKKDGLRRFKTVYVELPKGNAKSTLGAAIAIYLLTADGQKGGEVYSGAGDREQAKIIFDIASDMISAEPQLSSRCNLFKYSITYPKTNGFYKAVSSESKTKHGYNPSGIVFDELHVQPNAELWNTLRQGAVKRGNCLTFAFTTAGYDKQSICYKQHDLAIKIKKGIKKDDTFLPVIYAADEEDDISSMKTWRKANPGFGTIVREDFFHDQIVEIKNTPSHESVFKRLHLNLWVGTKETWVSDEVWMGNDSKPICEGPCFGGLDLASTVDTCALVLYFPETNSVLPFFWVPEEVVEERSRREGINYDIWVKSGLIYTTPGNAVDHEFINIKAKELIEEYNITSVAFDRYGSAKVVKFFNDHGLENKLDQFRQGYISMSAPCKELEKLAVNGEFRHGGNPVLRWMMSNVQLDQDAAANIKINKTKSREMVDGVQALAMAIGTSMTAEPEQRSRYEDNPEIETIEL